MEEIVNTFFAENKLVTFHLNSFDTFIEKRLPLLIKKVGNIVCEVEGEEEHKICFGEMRIGEPSLKEVDGSMSTWSNKRFTPMIARLRDLTYAAPLEVKIKLFVGTSVKEQGWIKICDLPVMIKSKIDPLSKAKREELIALKEDPDDFGGYFIINGAEKVIVINEDLASNKFFISKDGTVQGFYENGVYRVPHEIEKRKDGTIVISKLSRLPEIPVVVVLRALGMEKDKDIIDIIPNEEMYVNLDTDVRTKSDACEFIGNRLRLPKKGREERVLELLDLLLFPHIGQTPESRYRKALYLTRMIRVLLSNNKETDKDFYGNKELKLAGEMMESLIAFSINTLVNDIKYNFEKKIKRKRIPSLGTIVHSKLMTGRILNSLATGAWPGEKTGVSQLLSRDNIIATLSHLRRVTSSLSQSQQLMEARAVHGSQWGRICVHETPESLTIGLNKNLALFADVTTGKDKIIDEKEFAKMGVRLFENPPEMKVIKKAEADVCKEEKDAK